MGEETQLVGIIGDPVDRSLSPAIHNAAFRSLGIDWEYQRWPTTTATLTETVARIRNTPFRGANVTIPHKNDTAQLVDELVDDAKTLSTVNTIVARDDKLFGHTTDGDGFIDAMAFESVSLTDTRVVLIGAGGAAKAVALAVSRSNPSSLAIFNRTENKAQQLVDLIGARTRVATISDWSECDVIINATPIGTKPDEASRALVASIADCLTVEQTVVDLVYYEVADNALLKAAADRGARAINGLSMLIYQAARSFELWTGVHAPIDVMRAAT